MSPASRLLACVAFAGLTLASPAAQFLDFDALERAPAVTSGPAPLAVAATEHTIEHTTVISITGVATASATAAPTGDPLQRRATTSPYTPYYAALRTGYTTDPALAATSTTTANQPCVTQPEAGTYCGFINPLDACSPQPDGYGPVPDQDTPSAFLAYTKLHSAAQAAPTAVRSDDYATYKQVFKDLNGAVTGGSYLGLYSLQTYNVAECASRCDDTDLCTAFNIFAERDPSLRPANNDDDMPTVWGRYCPNPPSMTTFKCTLWGSSISAALATNTGQWQEDFQVVITASNGYDKTDNTTPPECSAPVTDTDTASATPTVPSYVTPNQISTTATLSPTSAQTSSTQVTSANQYPATSTPSSSSSSSKTTSSTAAPYTTATTAAPYTRTSSVATTSAPPPPPPGPTNQPYPGGPAPPGDNKPPGGGPTPPGGKPGDKKPPGYKPKPPVYPWGKPKSCSGKAIEAPKYSMGSQFFPGPYNPQLCSDYALLQNAANKKAGSKAQCQMFNAYYLHKNGVPFGTTCNLFSADISPRWATFSSARSPRGDKYDCKQSWTYTLKRY
ncbi:uncharacterized protein K489DRAFT_378354 [Dissoconium aciculare CBS 342.82]|uniref:Apple domain-containing protein n=1 Tax=Dissoconium aciculare CBS 342.82 TaxID=1314786 RepID=A0A6J3M7X6_9PEZI|nr:uncharacterized protein K489DRAFT_378354 [Dissoconium aciculare CBS 342.82]KAF1823978.1 hypothetical protein K489DRAFT_378354 [Dissoconium aciculare CBS 342.82]